MATIACPNPTNFSSNVPHLPHNGFTITKSDSDVFAVPVAVKVGATAGVVRCIPWGGTTTKDVEVGAYDYVPFMCRAVYSAGTTAATLTGSY